MITSSLRFRLFAQLVLAAVVLADSSIFAASPTPRTSRTLAGAIDEKVFNGMQWRQIGPFRGGRALAIEGIPDEPDIYYFGKRLMAEQTGNRFLIRRIFLRLAQSPSRHPIITSFMQAQGKLRFAATRLTEPAFINRSTPEIPGKTSG